MSDDKKPKKEEAPKVEKEELELETISSGASFHKFENEGDTYEGILTDQVVEAPEDDEQSGRKKGDLMGFVFEDLDGEQTIIGATAVIEKAITGACNAGDHLVITFKGKRTNSKNQPVNVFKIQRAVKKAE